MPPKSPPLAFEPSPTVFDSNMKENGPFTSPPARQPSISSEPPLQTDRRASKEVRFSPMTSPTGRSQSMSTNLPLLEQIPSASLMPRPNRLPSVSGSTDITAYIDQSRGVMENQRLSFDRERASWNEERKLWDTERAMMQARIRELEFAINKSGIRQSVTDSNYHHSQPFSPDHVTSGSISNGHDSRRSSSSGSRDHPIWEGSSSGTVATRVFSNEEMTKAEERLPSIAEDESSPSKALSPMTNQGQRKASVGIPIEMIDSKLDGITIKSTALPPAFIAKVITPTSPSPVISPSLRSNAPPPVKLQILGEANLEDTNLTKHAGHTPMGPRLAVQGIVDTQSGVDTPTQENPYAPQPSVRIPSEKADTYFPAPDDDPELKGPLGLVSKPENDNHFLQELDQRLLSEAHKAVYTPSENSVSGEQDDDGRDDDSEPKLKLKPSKNFGSSFGSSNCGTVSKWD